MLVYEENICEVLLEKYSRQEFPELSSNSLKKNSFKQKSKLTITFHLISY